MSQTTELISFKYGMWGHMYEENIMCKFDINNPSRYRDTRG